jgi:hypothetical protein
MPDFMKKRTKPKAASIELLQLLILELRSLMALTIQAAKARVRKPGPRRPRTVELVPGNFLKAVRAIP